jgi:type I restriction enzyme S subunit
VKSIKSVFLSGDVLYGKLRPYLNKVCRPEFDGACSTDILVFRESAALRNDFLMYLLSWDDVVAYASLRSKGVNLPRIGATDLGALPVNLPPLDEQRRIAEKISRLDLHSRATRRQLDAIPSLLAQLRAAVLSAAFSGRLTANWRKDQKRKGVKIESADGLLERLRAERRKRWEEEQLARMKAKGLKPKDDAWKANYRESEPLKVASLTVPGSWQSVALGELCSRLDYGSSAKSQRNGRVPVLRMGNLQSGEIDWTDLVFTSNKDEIAKYSLEAGTVLFNRTNSPELVGKTAIYRGERPAVFAGYLVRCQTLPGVEPEYLNYVLNADFSRQHCLRVKSDAVSQSNINATKLAGFEVPLCSVEEQREIVKRVATLLGWAQSVNANVQDAVRDLMSLWQAILAKAFRGELVPQNPKDEPASLLLKRIAEEIEKMKTEKKAAPKRGKRAKREIAVSLSETILQSFAEESFTFAQLRDVADGLYEDVKMELFALLRENGGFGRGRRLELAFDERSETMRLKVVKA